MLEEEDSESEEGDDEPEEIMSETEREKVILNQLYNHIQITFIIYGLI